MKVEGVTPGGGLKKTQSEVIETIVRPNKYARRMLWTAGDRGG